jgi:hypothetical protein
MTKALNRTTPKQIEHWPKIGEMMEDKPELPYEFVKQVIIGKRGWEARGIYFWFLKSKYYNPQVLKKQ